LDPVKSHDPLDTKGIDAVMPHKGSTKCNG
jgi:hypothetical protein